MMERAPNKGPESTNMTSRKQNQRNTFEIAINCLKVLEF